MATVKYPPRGKKLRAALRDPVAREALRRALHGDSTVSIPIEGKSYRLSPMFVPNRSRSNKVAPGR